MPAPQELDEAARRRMPKQLYIPLPCAAARQAMVERQLGPGSSVQSALSEADMRKIVEKTAGYSGMRRCSCAAGSACMAYRRSCSTRSSRASLLLPWCSNVSGICADRIQYICRHSLVS